MKRLLQAFRRILSALYKILPFFIGMYIYYPVFVERENLYPFLDAVYSSIKLYSGSTEGGIPVGGLLQLARFLALAATLSILIDALNKMADLVNWCKLRNPGATVVYGNSSYAARVLESLSPGIRIRGEGEFIGGAARYVLMFPGDEANLEFYSRYYERLRDKNVYMMLENIQRQNIENPRLTVFSLSEICARRYWRDHPVSRSEKIAVIGFGHVGEDILLFGLQVNLIDPEQHFEYHIYGDGTAFRREHTELDQMRPDEIVFHDDGAYGPDELGSFDRIILCGGEDESAAAAVSRLLLSAPADRPIQ